MQNYVNFIKEPNFIKVFINFVVERALEMFFHYRIKMKI